MTDKTQKEIEQASHALLYQFTKRVAELIDTDTLAAALASRMDESDIAQHICESSVADHLDSSEIASELDICYSSVADALDIDDVLESKVQDEVSDGMDAVQAVLDGISERVNSMATEIAELSAMEQDLQHSIQEWTRIYVAQQLATPPKWYQRWWRKIVSWYNEKFSK